MSPVPLAESEAVLTGALVTLSQDDASGRWAGRLNLRLRQHLRLFVCTVVRLAMEVSERRALLTEVPTIILAILRCQLSTAPLAY